MKSARLLLHLLLLTASSSIVRLVVNAQPHTKRDITYRISGGVRVPETQKFTRFMVSLRSRKYKMFFGDNHYCAGIIISSNFVLTAASCVSDKRKVSLRPRRLLVVAGTTKRLERTDTTVEFTVKSIHIHPKFMHKGPYNAAMVRIHGSFPTGNANIEIMELPKGPPPYGSECLILGWGRMYFDGPVANGVLHTTLTLMEDKLCQKENSWYKPGLLCAIDNTNMARAACRGDSGGPFICNNELAGIISIARDCGKFDEPIFFTSVFHTLHFIKDVMNAANRNLLSLLPMVLCTVEMSFLANLN